jgi:exopolyphosphatase/guanosine-5'-triphosphate,3'-diphosphate pyrophosphatase
MGAAERARLHGQHVLAVCDVGGGSAQISVGTKQAGPTWVRSIDIGSMRLTARSLSADPPGESAMATARAEVDELLRDIAPPPAEIALAVGGSARALRAIAGNRLDEAGLAAACALLAITPADTLVRDYGVSPGRGKTLAAGAVILSAIRDLLGLPLQVVRGGVREGAVLELESRRRAAA